ncbi:MAG: tetratricopeptide repeat protein [Chloroflexi bacterium]|nr:tetratricopeptide repeat protein [Chloroflexota bacterium]
MRPLANLGSAYSRQGKYDDGLAALQKGLAACRDIGDRRGEALFLNNIAANHLMRGEREKARPFLEACLPVCDEIQFDQVKQVALYNLGEIYLHQAQYESAITVCQAAADIARRLQDRMSLARALKIVGVAQIRQGDFVSAWRSLQEGLAAAETTAALPAIFDVLDGMADYYLAVSRQAEARVGVEPTHRASAPEVETQHAAIELIGRQKCVSAF